MRLRRLLVRRIVFLPVSVWVVVTLAFGLVELLPGDPARTILGPAANPQQIARVRGELGLDEPLLTRYVHYLWNLMHGSLGHSFFTGSSVVHELRIRLPATVELVVLSLIVAAGVGTALGGIAAYSARRPPGRLSNMATSVLQSIPDFLAALVGIYFLYYLARIAPAPVGQLSIGAEGPRTVTGMTALDSLITGDWGAFTDSLGHLFLPVLALGLVYSAYFARTTRSALGRALASDQVEFARACGLRERTVIRYAFLEARAPIVTYGAILLGAVVGGDSIVETIFAWEGVGQWALSGILRLDVPVIRGFIVIMGVITIAVYLVLDIVVALLDPRVQVN